MLTDRPCSYRVMGIWGWGPGLTLIMFPMCQDGGFYTTKGTPNVTTDYKNIWIDRNAKLRNYLHMRPLPSYSSIYTPPLLLRAMHLLHIHPQHRRMPMKHPLSNALPTSSPGVSHPAIGNTSYLRSPRAHRGHHLSNDRPSWRTAIIVCSLASSLPPPPPCTGHTQQELKLLANLLTRHTPPHAKTTRATTCLPDIHAKATPVIPRSAQPPGSTQVSPALSSQAATTKRP